MITAWNAGAVNAPLLLSWVPPAFALITASVGLGLDFVKIWDVGHERCVGQLAASPAVDAGLYWSGAYLVGPAADVVPANV